MSMNLILMKCPGCGASLELIPGNQTAVCDYCGNKFMVDSASSSNVSNPNPAPEMSVTENNATEISPYLEKKLKLYILKQFKKETGIKLDGDAMAMKRIIEACRKAIPELTNTGKSEINIPFITADGSGPKHVSLVVKAFDMKNQ
ncbi:Hsp70 family protein [Myxococcota bacterium]|nr:Hsp70 family protein [Myxococcota bacterium]MBU1383207.1 Hsp70 family protein [Myxococcota bacterium]MBU1496441.1 Hsp70 family protein [Myxococcota bacterium]